MFKGCDIDKDLLADTSKIDEIYSGLVPVSCDRSFPVNSKAQEQHLGYFLTRLEQN